MPFGHGAVMLAVSQGVRQTKPSPKSCHALSPGVATCSRQLQCIIDALLHFLRAHQSGLGALHMQPCTSLFALLPGGPIKVASYISLEGSMVCVTLQG